MNRETTLLRSIGDLFPASSDSDPRPLTIACRPLDAVHAVAIFPIESSVDATMALLVLAGRGALRINGRRHELESDRIVLLSVSHRFLCEELSPDFRCICLMVSEQFMHEMDAADMIYRRIKYGAKLYNTPAMPLSPEAAHRLSERMESVRRAIDNWQHTYYKELILNELNGFYLDLSDAIERGDPQAADLSTRYGRIVQSFVQLLAAHCLREHRVSFYSSRLNLSDHYLTLIVKRVMGQSPSDLIYGMVYSHARTLLATSRLSIQEIALQLNFSDQSAFGKFFKRHAGLTPHEYRTLNQKR